MATPTVTRYGRVVRLPKRDEPTFDLLGRPCWDDEEVKRIFAELDEISASDSEENTDKTDTSDEEFEPQSDVEDDDKYEYSSCSSEDSSVYSESSEDDDELYAEDPMPTEEELAEDDVMKWASDSEAETTDADDM